MSHSFCHQRLLQFFKVFRKVGHQVALRSSGVNANNNANGFTFLQSTFSDINANLQTSEDKCCMFIKYYNNISRDERAAFLRDLAKNYGIHPENVVTVAKTAVAVKDKGDVSLLASSEKLRSSLKPKFKTLFTHIGRVDGGVKFLVDCRADVLSIKQSCTSEMDGALFQELNIALMDLLRLWFTVGLLNLERITWNSSCDLVQKISSYEAVHRIKTWEDIKRRVGPYRRCYIFTHNSMPGEPVVVLHTALTTDISSNIQVSSSEKTNDNLASQHYLEKEEQANIKWAIFYSITSTQKGLQGIDLGNYLIKSVVRRLQEEFPHLQNFFSLSPIPGFRDWIVSTLNHRINQHGKHLEALVPYQNADHNSLLDTFKDQILSHTWYRDQTLQRIMSPLMRLCANYLYIQKRRNYALNPMANFHLSNGAVLWRINFLGDTSIRGLNQSCGLMVNYRYFLDSTEANSRNYLEKQQIRASAGVLKLLEK
ncbi:unnamed protein product [Lymnaea stagnalis]|uniref:Malonyl-CoA decarboxylase, mitochondrial n=1 Tax=Lymnaea stagnalis TaxID=6523 RepID=A0AAV2IK33_LYMST